MKICLIVFCLALNVSLVPESLASWPSIQPVQATVGFDRQASMFDVSIAINGLDGKPLYWFMCIGGSDRYLDRLSGSTDFNYVGPLLCRLDTKPSWDDSSLLAENGEATWHTRGRFSFNELKGKCAEYPEYGRLRNFRLRGMHISLAVQHVSQDENGKIQYFQLAVDVKEDHEAELAFPAPPAVKSPWSVTGLICDGNIAQQSE